MIRNYDHVFYKKCKNNNENKINTKTPLHLCARGSARPLTHTHIHIHKYTQILFILYSINDGIQ